jgi:hypothetical protein
MYVHVILYKLEKVLTLLIYDNKRLLENGGRRVNFELKIGSNQPLNEVCNKVPLSLFLTHIVVIKSRRVLRAWGYKIYMQN